MLGQHPEYDCRDGGGYLGWYSSIADLEQLGVRNVSVMGNEWRPAAPVPDTRFCRVALDPS